MGQELGQLPAHAGDSPRLRAPTAPSPLPCRGCPEPQRCHTRCDRPCSQHSHSQQGTAATPTLLHCLLLARSSKSGQLHAPSSAFQEKAFLVIIRNTSQHTLPFLKKVSLKGNTQVQKHTASASSLLQGLPTDWKRQKSKHFLK